MSDALDDQAAAALWALRLSADERMGAIYREGEGYARTPTIQGGDSGVRGQLQVPRGMLAALFHNHPSIAGADAERSKFSTDDKTQAQRLRVPSYIGVGDKVLRYQNGKTEEVLAMFPMAEFRAQMMRTLLDRAPDDPRGLMR